MIYADSLKLMVSVVERMGEIFDLNKYSYLVIFFCRDLIHQHMIRIRSHEWL